MIEIEGESIFINEPLINCDKDGAVKTIKAQYFKNGLSNFVRNGSTFGASGVIEKK